MYPILSIGHKIEKDLRKIERQQMERKKIVAIITGAISLILAIAYLFLVQLLDFRGPMQPAPLSQLPTVAEYIS